jgi:hypothetical protein
VLVHRRVRGPDGRLYVDIEHPDGRSLRLPVEWTDLVPTAIRTESPPRSTTRALAVLCSHLATLDAADLDSTDARGSSSRNTKHVSSNSDAPTSSQQPTSGVDDASTRGGVGGAGASDPRCRGGYR